MRILRIFFRKLDFFRKLEGLYKTIKLIDLNNNTVNDEFLHSISLIVSHVFLRSH